MALTELASVLGELTPHVEEAAIKVSFREYAVINTFLMFTDMEGFNTRKVSEYIRSRRAVDLDEDTPIPDTKMLRARLSEISPIEIGERYRISDRRQQTDLENIVADAARHLGYSIGSRRESDAIQAALSAFTGGSLGSASTDYDIGLPIAAQYELAKRNERGVVYHVVHPFQVREVMSELIKYNVNTSAPDFLNQAISVWQVPSFMGLRILISDFLPRHIIFKLAVYGDGGTFRLSVKDATTADISVSITPATMAANVKAALDALGFGTWTVTENGIDDLTVTPPSDLYLDAEQELRVAVDPDNPTAQGHKSAFDEVTNPTGPADVEGTATGVEVLERSASAKSLLYMPDSMVYDLRERTQVHFETVHQGRTGEWAAYEKYGIGGWRPYRGMFIETKASSALAVGP